MINLWYENSYWSHTNGRLSGPEKVVKNTIDSLQQEKVDYAMNEEKYSFNFLIQYQHMNAYKKHEMLEHDSCIIGPQIWLFQNDKFGKFLIENPQYYKYLIAPSKWVKNKFVTKLGLPEEKVAIWPVGIEDFSNYDKKVGNSECLIYFKSRSNEELNQVQKFLDSKKITHQVIQYGNYSEEEFIETVKSSKFCFIIDNTESQGIAIQQIMSTNTPLLVWDVQEWNYLGDKYKVPATSVPYWSDDCGEKFYNLSELDITFDRFYGKINTYNPKKLIDAELSYKISVEKLINCFK
jgi:hypothetical protein